MTSKIIMLTRKEYSLIAKNKGIKEPQKMSTEELLNTLYRYDIKCEVKSNRRKLNKINLKKNAKKQNISRNELCKAERLQNKSKDELQEIAKLRRIKNYDNLTREGLIFSFLKSESNLAERNYMEYFNNSTNDEIKSKINDIRLILSRLGNIVTKIDRKKIKKQLYEIEKKQNLSENEKETIYDHLVKLTNTLDKKGKHKHSDHYDLDYFGIRELKKLFDDIDIDDDNYYKPVLIRSSLKESLKEIMNTMRLEEIKIKNYQ